jgi:hypothetical protein
VSVNADTVTITRRSTAEVAQHPRRQAREYMLRLMDECRRHPQAGSLIQKEGRHAGGFAFPFCHIVVLSNINRSQIEREAPELSHLFPSDTTITRDELATWDALEPQALLPRLKACFDPWWVFPKLTSAQIDIVRSVVHPEVIIRASETDLAVLDLRQERKCAGTGGWSSYRLWRGRLGQDRSADRPGEAARGRPGKAHHGLVLQPAAQGASGGGAGQPSSRDGDELPWLGRQLRRRFQQGRGGRRLR